MPLLLTPGRGRVRGEVGTSLHPAPCSLHPPPCSLHPTPCSLSLHITVDLSNFTCKSEEERRPSPVPGSGAGSRDPATATRRHTLPTPWPSPPPPPPHLHLHLLTSTTTSAPTPPPPHLHLLSSSPPPYKKSLTTLNSSHRQTANFSQHNSKSCSVLPRHRPLPQQAWAIVHGHQVGSRLRHQTSPGGSRGCAPDAATSAPGHRLEAPPARPTRERRGGARWRARRRATRGGAGKGGAALMPSPRRRC